MEKTLTKKDNKKHTLPKMLYVDMGKRLRRMRVEQNYTQEQLAEIIGVSTAYYGKIERGEHGLSLVRLVTINQKLNVDINYLLTGIKSSSFTLEKIISECPRDKQYDMEKLILHAANLAREKNEKGRND